LLPDPPLSAQLRPMTYAKCEGVGKRHPSIFPPEPTSEHRATMLTHTI
jgi:hypothetical protein